MKIGLALCGGGSLGSYEVGAIEKLYEKGLSFDIITGSSIGALNGYFVATHSFKELIKFWETIEVSDIIKNGFNTNKAAISKLLEKRASQARSLLVSYFQNFGVDIAPYRSLLERAIDLNAIKEEGAAKLGVIYTSYPSFKENRALINEEPEDMILHYLYASSACFPIFPLHKIGKKTYIDGGFSNNLPIDYALDLGADYVYAIGLRSFPTPPQKPHFLTLPNVKTIFQSRSLGFMMDFDPKTLARNRIIGYLDAGRVLGDYYGSKYALRHSETDLEKAHAFFMKALEKGPKSFKSLKTLFHVKGKKIDEISLYVGALEFVAGMLEVDEYHLYSFDTMLDAIKDKAAKVNDALKKRKPNIRYLSEMILGKEIDKKTKRGVNAKLLLMPPLL